MRRLYFVVNPISGSGQGRTRFEQTRRLLDARGADYGFAYTEYAGHAVTLAKAALEAGERCLVAVGGDGTLRETAGVLADREGVELGILPFGTGNDFARGVGLPEETEALVEILLKGKARPVDAGDADGEFFMNVAGFGFDVDVVRYTEKYKKKLNGMLPYLLGIFQSLLHLSRTKVRVETDAGESFEVTATLFSVCNGSRFAGGIRVAPLASPSDGLFDVCILKKASLPVVLWLLPIYVRGKHLKYKKYFDYFKARSVRAECACAPLELDGELIGQAPATFAVRPGAIRLILGD
ncbi:MAG TPA: diacylglycerol kinase family protein [Clostridia bacterium]|nr:diacylglycerol kinase family protein [Clostridia bacterium]